MEHLRAVQKRVEGDPSREAMVVAKLANWYAMTDPVLADQYVRRALALCERSDDVSELFTRMTLASPLMIPSLLADAFANVERLEELALAFGIEQVTKYVMCRPWSDSEMCAVISSGPFQTWPNACISPSGAQIVDHVSKSRWSRYTQ